MALNHAVPGRKIPGSSIKSPTAHIKTLVSCLILLLQTEQRDNLHLLMEFCARCAATKAPTGRAGYIRAVAIALGPCLVPKGKLELRAGFFELLVHCHGILDVLPCNLQTSKSAMFGDIRDVERRRRDLWCVSPAIMLSVSKAIKQLYKLKLTPRKLKSTVKSKPTSVLRPGSLSVKRVLFRSEPRQKPEKNLGFIA